MKKEVTLNEEEIQRIYRHLGAAQRHYELLKDFICQGRMTAVGGPALDKDTKDVNELMRWLAE